MLFLTPSLKHFAGTDDLGRDIYKITLWKQIFNTIRRVSTVGALIIGIFIGSISGYFMDRLIIS